MRQSAVRVALLVALAALVAVAACSPDGGAGPDATRTPGTPAADAFTRLMAAAAGGEAPAGSDLDRQWAAAFEVIDIDGARPYEPPSAVLAYRAGEVPDMACAGPGDGERWRDNAAYCPADQRIVYDEDWMRALGREVGDAAPLAILAHEWGHHVQWLLGRNVEDLREELHADCLAGMYLSASGLLPHDSLEAEDPALTSALVTFFSLGNTRYRASEWFAAQEHGSPVQRILATSTGLGSVQAIDASPGGGMEKGVPFCHGYLDYEVGDVATIGPYRFVELPGRVSRRDGDVYVLEPEERTGQPSSIVAMLWVPRLPLAGGATAAQLEALWADPAWEGIDTLDPEPSISASGHGGTGIAAAYQYVRPDGAGAQAGIFGLVSPADGIGGLLVLAFQPRLATDDADALRLYEEAIVTINQVMARLCTPDESADPAAPNLDPVCMDVQ